MWIQNPYLLPANPLVLREKSRIECLSRRAQKQIRLARLREAFAVDTMESVGNLVASSQRGPSYSIWADYPAAAVAQDPSLGMHIFDDFIKVGGWLSTNTAGGSMGDWASYGSTGSLQTDGALEGGVISLGSDGDQESATIASLAGAFRITTTSTLALNNKLWFETRVAFGTIATTKMDAFVGLADKLTSSNIMVNTIPISTTDDTLSTVPNLIGFHKKSGASTEINFVYQLAGGTAVYPTNLTTLMNSVTGAVLVAQSGQTGFVKLGFLFDPTAPAVFISSASTGQTAGVLARPLIKIFVNGLPAAAFLTSTNVQGTAFPTGFMGPVFSVMQTATGANQGLIDWIRVAQLGSF